MPFLMVYLNAKYDPFMPDDFEEWEVDDAFAVEYHGKFVQFHLGNKEVISYHENIVNAWYLSNESTLTPEEPDENDDSAFDFDTR